MTSVINTILNFGPRCVYEITSNKVILFLSGLHKTVKAFYCIKIKRPIPIKLIILMGIKISIKLLGAVPC